MTCYLREHGGSRPDARWSNVLENLSDSSKVSQDFSWESGQNSPMRSRPQLAGDCRAMAIPIRLGDFYSPVLPKLCFPFERRKSSFALT